MNDQVATRIRRARLEAGLSREHLAGKIGVSLATVRRYETGHSHRISLMMLNDIAIATEKPLVWFLEDAA